jgi:hypothetical protein
MSTAVLTILIPVAATWAAAVLSRARAPRARPAPRQRAFWADWRDFVAWAFSISGRPRKRQQEGVDSVGFVQAVAEKVTKDVPPPRGDWGDGSLADFEEETKEIGDEFERKGFLTVSPETVIEIRKSKRLETTDEPRTRKEPESVGFNEFNEFEDGF